MGLFIHDPEVRERNPKPESPFAGNYVQFCMVMVGKIVGSRKWSRVLPALCFLRRGRAESLAPGNEGEILLLMKILCERKVNLGRKK